MLLSVFSSRNSDVTSALNSLNNGLGTFVGSQAGNTSPSLATGGDSRYRNLRIRVPESNRIGGIGNGFNNLNISPNMGTVHMMQSATTIIKALHTLEVLDSNLTAYLHLIVPALVSLIENASFDVVVRVEGLKTLMRLNYSLNFVEYASRIIHSLLRVLDKRPGMGSPGGIRTPSSAKNGAKSDANASTGLLEEAAIDTLCGIVREMGARYSSFIPVVADVLDRQNISSREYNRLVTAVINGSSLPGRLRHSRLDNPNMSDSGTSGQLQSDPPRDYLGSMTTKLSVDQQNLRNAWVASQRSTPDDWYEWLRRFSVELLGNHHNPRFEVVAHVHSFTNHWQENYSTLLSSHAGVNLVCSTRNGW